MEPHSTGFEVCPILLVTMFPRLVHAVECTYNLFSYGRTIFHYMNTPYILSFTQLVDMACFYILAVVKRAFKKHVFL